VVVRWHFAEGGLQSVHFARVEFRRGRSIGKRKSLDKNLLRIWNSSWHGASEPNGKTKPSMKDPTLAFLILALAAALFGFSGLTGVLAHRNESVIAALAR